MAATDRLHGKKGAMKMDPTGGSSTVIVASISKFDLDLSTEKVPVTAFQDTNRIYVQGLPDVKGSYSGWYDPADGLVIFDVTTGTVAPFLELVPTTDQPLVMFSGKAYVDSKISVDSGGGIAISGSFVAAGPWTLPSAA